MANERKNVNTKGIVFSTVMVSAMTILFKILGFVKQAVIASYFGADKATDLYFVAGDFVSMVGELFVYSVSVAIVSVYSYMLVNEGRRQADKLISAVLETLLPVAFVVVCVINLASPFIAHFLAPGYTSDSHTIIAGYLRSLSPIVLLYVVQVAFNSVLEANKKFLVCRLHSLTTSIAVMAACILLSEKLGVKALIAGRYASYLLLFPIVFYACRHLFKFRFTAFWNNKGLKQVVFTSLPLFVSNGVFHINQIVDKVIASSLGAGAVSALSYCHVVEQLVSSIILTNLGNIMFAYFADMLAHGDVKQMRSTLSNAIDVITFCLVPIAVIFFFSSYDIVELVYRRGNFSHSAAILTSTALMGYVVCWPFVGINDLSTKALYAFKDTKSPLFASCISIFCNICLSIVLAKRIGIIGLSLATSISMIPKTILTSSALKKKLSAYSYKHHVFSLIRLVLPGTMLAMVIVLFRHLGIDNTFLRLALTGLCGIPVYIGVCRLTSNPTLSTILSFAGLGKR